MSDPIGLDRCSLNGLAIADRRGFNSMRFFEDFPVGFRQTYGETTVEAEAILAFARVYDPQPMHLDANSMQARMVGGLIASGWHICSLNMRLMADGFLLSARNGLGAPGVHRVDWRAPIRPGDRVTGAFEVIGKRASRSKPDRGFVNLRISLARPDGSIPFEQENLVMFRRRDAMAPIPAPEGVDAPPRTAEHLTPHQGDNPPLGQLKTLLPGETRRYGTYHFSADAIRTFAQAFDPQEFHLDDMAGRTSHFGGLSASGWHIASAWMQSMIASTRDTLRANDRPLPRLGPSPGFRDMRWIKPVLAGDTLTYFSRFIEGRRSATRPGWGIAKHRNYAFNQRDELVFAFTGIVLWEAGD
ncbi:MaoC-like dehydratase domain containing protein [Rhabdaerophilaceae bacterium]